MADNSVLFKTADGDQRRFPRVTMNPLHRISLRFVPGEKKYKIANISIGGLGFFSEGFRFSGTTKRINAELSIGERVFTIETEIMHQGPDITGCQFSAPSTELVAAIEDYFKLELAALKMKTFVPKRKVGGIEKTTIFRGQNNCELFLCESNSELQSFGLMLFGNYFECDKFGKVAVGEPLGEESYKIPDGVHLFRPVGKVEKHLVESAIRFIHGIPGLEEQQRSNVLSLLKNPINN